jgi:hypothetical protein
VKFLGHANPLERKYTMALRKYFFMQRKAILEALFKDTKEVGHIFSFDWEEQDDKLIMISEPIIAAAIVKGSEIMAESLGVDPFTLSNPLVADCVTAHTTRLVNINRVTERHIRERVADGLRSQMTINQIADEIRIKFDLYKSRSILIARTETTGALNEGEQLILEEAGAEQKIWITAGDEKVRDNHSADEKASPIDVKDVFPNTGLMFPGDQSNGDASEVCNCRCTLLSA